MEELPKFVRQRLAHRAEHDSKSAPDALRGAVHPDANLLSAFAERSLSESERMAVLGHLADCAECRELVSLAFPSEAQAAPGEVAASTHAGGRWPVWLGWRTLRWGVLAASVAVVMAGAFRSGILKWPAAPNTARNTVAEVRTTPSLVAPPPPASPAPSTQSYSATGAPSADARGMAVLRDKVADEERARSESRLARRGDIGASAKRKPLAAAAPALQSAERKKVFQPLAAPAAPRPAKEGRAEYFLKTEPVPSEPNTANKANKDSSAVAANAVTGNGRAAAVSANEPGTPSRMRASVGGLAKTAPAERELDQKLPPSSQAVEVQAQTAAPEKKADQLKEQSNVQNGQAQAAAVGQATAPPPQAPVAREPSQQGVASGLVPQTTQQVMAKQQQAGTAVARQAEKGQRAPLKLYWNISASGQIERARAAGGPWSRVRVDDRVKFQAVSAEGNDVWAGGSGGALYHSTDGGAHWSRVRVGPNRPDDQVFVTDAIISLRFSDPEHGQVVTDAHETWTTTDGGAHWSLAP